MRITIAIATAIAAFTLTGCDQPVTKTVTEKAGIRGTDVCPEGTPWLLNLKSSADDVPRAQCVSKSEYDAYNVGDKFPKG